MRKLRTFRLPIAAFFSLALGICQAQSVLTHHVRQATQDGSARSLGRLPASQTMNLVITLPLRNQDQLDQLLQDLYDPTARATGSSLPWSSSPSSSGPRRRTTMR